MTCKNILDINYLSTYYDNLGGKKLFKDCIKDFNSYINKKVYLYYSNKKDTPVCALPKFKILLVTRLGFLSFCYNFYFYVNGFDYYNIDISQDNLKIIAKCVCSHEIGHILDDSINSNRWEQSKVLTDILEKMLHYNIDFSNIDFHKKNLPQDLENSVLIFKKNLVGREAIAWEIARNIMHFHTPKERFIFDKVREYALATYNYGDLKSIIKENNLESFFKYKKYFA
ncbi:hypothetical protein [Terrisporobacter sp.]|uniref:hypothetical protein n=1 Tax=Terrisporobacter sp. TaxID=1965305 RepID=UPI002607BEFA|nr:hypothetical protein [Terrisporobacter sp.]